MLSDTGRHLLRTVPQNLLHAETDTRPVTAALTGAFLFGRLYKVIAVLFAQHAAELSVLPKIAGPAGCGSVTVITHTVNDNDFVFAHGILHILK